jgi:hypothetical protein
VPRGPFTTTKDWICARLSLVLTDQERIIKTSDNEDDIEEAEDAKEIALELSKLLPRIFHSNDSSIEPCILFHDDLFMQNILVDSDGKITGFIDWECVSALSLWRACEIPGFLKGRDRNEKPKRDQYAPDNVEDNGEDNGGLTRQALDNEGMNSLHWEHLLEYELTMLRELFLKEMGSVSPEWIEELEKGVDKADFEEAVQNCDNSWRNQEVKSWLDAFEKGEHWNLEKSLLA